MDEQPDVENENDFQTYILFSISNAGEEQCEIVLNPKDGINKIAKLFSDITSGKLNTSIMDIMMNTEDPEDIVLADQVIDAWGSHQIQNTVEKFQSSSEPLVKPSEFFAGVRMQ